MDGDVPIECRAGLRLRPPRGNSLAVFPPEILDSESLSSPENDLRGLKLWLLEVRMDGTMNFVFPTFLPAPDGAVTANPSPFVSSLAESVVSAREAALSASVGVATDGGA